MLSDERFARFDLSAMESQAWWDANIINAQSKLLATCRDCGWVCATTSLANLMRGQSFGCACKNKTETILLKWLCRTFGEEAVEFQIQGCINPQTGRQLPFDYGITAYGASRLILLELDGTIGHFGKDFHGNETRDYALQVVRVLQTDVWHDRSNWQNYLKQSISAASASRRPLTPALPGL